jgi:hypothetical protein
MAQVIKGLTLGVAIVSCLSACGGGSSEVVDTGDGQSPPPLVSYIGTTGVFAAWADDTTGTYAAAAASSYAGKKQSLRGTLDFMTGAQLSQPAGIEIYKGSDGHIYGVDLTSTSSPTEQQLSSEATATVDDTCTLSGTAVQGANYDYVGVYFTADLQTPTNSSYFYRLPGPDGVCNTADDVVHMVKTGMSPASAPIVASDMPIATVRTSQGGIAGFVVKDGANLLLVDSNFANPIVLGTFSAPIGTAVALPVGTTQGYPTGQLFEVDGNIVYVDYAARSVSGSLFSIPTWKQTSSGASFAASPDTLYFAINTPASGSTPASAQIYSMPADGSAVPLQVVAPQPGSIGNLIYPVQGSSLLFAAAYNGSYSIESLSAANTITTLVSTSTQNSGSFIATASAVYYETWTGITDNTAKTVTHSGTQSGIVGMDGSVIQAPLANSTFVNGGEQEPWPNDTTTTNTPYVTVFQVRGLTPVTVTNPSNGYQYTEDGVSGGSLVAISTTSNQLTATIGTLPATAAVSLSGTFRADSGSGFLEASNPASTQNPATRDLYLLNSQTANSLVRVTGHL